MHELAARLLKTIRKQELLKPGDRLAVAVSGGADSVALLLLLLELCGELGVVLSVAHVNHKLRGNESDEDERFVADLARWHDLPLHAQDAPVSFPPQSGIEAAARRLRYDFFRWLVRENRLSKIATAHTLDDQAETVLLRILRGTGIRGLSGIQPKLMLEEAEGRALGVVIRPLLGFRRAELQAFLRERGQVWREDSSNRDLGFLRNRMRHELLPIMEKNFGAAVVENLADLAEIARAEEEHWAGGHPEVRALVGSASSPQQSLPIASLLALPLAAQRRAIRAWLDRSVPDLSVSFRMIEEAIDVARGAPDQQLDLPAGHILRRNRERLRLDSAVEMANAAAGYEYPLQIPGRVEIRELGMEIEAVAACPGDVPEAERSSLLDPGRMPTQLMIRNWRAGDRFWPAHTKEAQKVKDLLNDRHIIGLEKRLWPVADAEGFGLVWMRGFAVPAEFGARPGVTQAIWIRVRDGSPVTSSI